MSDINFKISVKEANIIFKALGNLPFSEVYELIGKLNDQANAQLTNGSHELNGRSGKESLGLSSSPTNEK
ncbi:MAG: hypothetical protein ACK4ND_03860 [Cytophagaceae bacterium]